ncbi:ABC transporter permease [candidate division KSB1 bacterium]|nr:ABC transporter permease [candidate division KSB1 bacterium]
MFKNYLKIALRNLIANKLYAVINVVALSVAMACAVVAYLNYDYSRSFDRFHENAERIFVARSTVTVNDREQNYGITPLPLGPALARDFAQVEKMARVVYSLSALEYGDKIFNEVTYYVDESFFEMFTFPLKLGSHEAIHDKSKLFISEDLALKYFGEDDPLGKQVSIHYSSGKTRDFFVGGVVQKIPANSSLQFDVLIPYAVLAEVSNEPQESWANWAHETFIQLASPVEIAAISRQLDRYLAVQNAASPDFQIARLYFDPFAQASQRARALTNDILKEGVHPAAVLAPSIIAVLLLLTACFNFMNTSLAFSALRLKEVGVRKVLGGLRRQLIAQFIGENLLLCTIALLIAIGLAEWLVPAYSNLWTDFDLVLNYRENWGLLAFLIGLLAFMSFAAGAYPALYVSAFSPVAILKGNSILTFQFALSTMTIIAGIVFTHNARFFEQLDLGFDAEQTIAVPLRSANVYTAYRNAVEQNPSIQSVSGTRHQVGYNQAGLLAESESKKHQVAVLSVGAEYLETMGMQLVQGRSFDPNLATDKDQALIVNEKMAADFNWSEPLGKQVTIDSVRYTVIGVVKNFYNRSVWRPMQACALRLTDPEQFRYLVVRTDLHNVVAANEFLREIWQRLSPNVPYAGFYQDEVLAEAVQVNGSIKLLFIYISMAAIAIAVMGLFALSSLIIVKRTKEIGIRKVLGASVAHIVQLLNRQIVAVLVVASILAALGGYFSLEPLMSSIFAYHVNLQAWHFVLAGAIVFMIGLITVSSQVYRVATANPVESLRYE